MCFCFHLVFLKYFTSLTIIYFSYCRAFFNDFTKSAAVENNHSESYNAVLKDARRKPVVALLEDIRRHVMSSNLLKIKEMQNATGLIKPKAKAVID